MRCSPRKARSRSGNSESIVMAVRNPRPPRFTGNNGTSRPPMARAAESSVPSPPSTITRSAPSGTSSRGSRAVGTGVLRRLVIEADRDVAVASQRISFGTSSAAAGTPGFEMMPTVLMSGIEQKFLVPFRAGNRAFHDAGLEAQTLHGVRLLARTLLACSSGRARCRLFPLALFPLRTVA